MRVSGRIRSLTARPLIAIGGIAIERAQRIDAGADSVAVIGDLYPGGGSGAHAQKSGLTLLTCWYYNFIVCVPRSLPSLSRNSKS